MVQPGNGEFSVTTPAPGGGVSNVLVYTAYVPLVNNDAVFNAVDGLWYASTPASAGTSTGNSILSIDPATGVIGAPIAVGTEPKKLALAVDGRGLWVALDGASAIRKVDLTTKTAGAQFALPDLGTGMSDAHTSVLALAALPGSADSVVAYLSRVGVTTTTALCLFDSGVLRGSCLQSGSTSFSASLYALQVDASRNEIYAGGESLATFTYDSSGLTLKAISGGTSSSSSPIQLADATVDEMQSLDGRLYGDLGQVYDAETGNLLVTLPGTNPFHAFGPVLVDARLKKILVLASPGLTSLQRRSNFLTPAITPQRVRPFPSISPPTSTARVRQPATYPAWGAMASPFVHPMESSACTPIFWWPHPSSRSE